MIKFLPKVLILLLIPTIAACKPDTMVNEMCVFSEADLIREAPPARAEELFQLGRSYDISVISNAPETIPPELRGHDYDRAVARDYYEQAAKLGHTGAMNNFAVYLQNGWGLNDDSYPKDHDAAFYWNREMARRGDPRGYVSMSGYFHTGIVVKQDKRMSARCLVEAAKLDHMPAQLLLAALDLGIERGSGLDVVLVPERVERGRALAEDAAFKGEVEALKTLSDYYIYNVNDPDKSEFYGRLATIRGKQNAVAGGYTTEEYGLGREAEAECIFALSEADLPNLEALCPRPGGPLTRAGVGLPPAPTQPLDVKAYLEDFAGRNPDL